MEVGGGCSAGVLHCSSSSSLVARGGHFPLLATRCNADSSQGYTIMDDEVAPLETEIIRDCCSRVGSGRFHSLENLQIPNRITKMLLFPTLMLLLLPSI